MKTKTYNNSQSTEKEHPKQRLCPFIDEHFHDCFPSDLRSQNVEAAIYYCNGHFEECEIYRRQGRR
jgi:hypothetical protein